MIKEALEKLLALTSADVALDDLARREVEARARLDSVKSALEAFRNQVKEEKKQLDEVMKEKKLIELDVKTREDQIKKYSTQMYDVKTNKEYTAIQEEIAKAKVLNQGAEDKLLAIMMKEDELKGLAGRRAQDVAEAEKKSKAEEAEVDGLLKAIEAERAAKQADKEQRLKEMKPDSLRLYERIRRARGGAPLSMVVEASGGKGEAACGECHMTIRPQIIVEIHKQEELIACEFCGRILYLPSDAPDAAKLPAPAPAA